MASRSLFIALVATTTVAGLQTPVRTWAPRRAATSRASTADPPTAPLPLESEPYPEFDPDFVPPPPTDPLDSFFRATNSAMRSVTIAPVRDAFEMRRASDFGTGGPLSEKGWRMLTSPPESPGIPRGVSLTILGSVPTALGWYGYYKFSVEEELFQDELRREGKVSGAGGYGTLLPFVFAFLIGGAATAVGVEEVGGPVISLGSFWILAGQVNLYRRVNELCLSRKELGLTEAPLWAWWALLPPPLDVVVGLRQVHYLARYWTSVRGEPWEEDKIAEEYFPFISSGRFTLKEFVQEPRRWSWFTGEWEDWF